MRLRTFHCVVGLVDRLFSYGLCSRHPGSVFSSGFGCGLLFR